MKQDGLRGRLDRFQSSRRWTAFAFAVAKKFGDDRAGSLAALIAYYGFLSLFPLLLALVTIAGLVLSDDPALRDLVIGSALAQFPIVGDRIGSTIRSLDGSGWVILIGLATALWAGLGGVGAAQRALDDVWDVPRRDRPPFVRSRLRALVMLGVLGSFVVATSVLGAAAAALGTAWLVRALVLATTALNAVTALLAYRVLTVAEPAWKDLFPGAILAGISWTVLQAIGGWLVESRIRGASEVYGTFAIVIGLLAWISLAAQVFLLGAEVNVVRASRLWPRRLFPPPIDDADRRAVAGEAREAALRPEVAVEVSFDDRAYPGVRSDPPG